MRLGLLKVVNLRPFRKLKLSFTQDFVVLVGPNGSGKTTILEGVFYASTLRIPPPAKPWELVSFGENFFRLELEVDGQKTEFYYGKKDERRHERSQSLNGVKKKAREILGALPTVIFLPQDLNLLWLSPALRRAYLDEVLLQIEPDYGSLLSEYAKVLLQRNELLSRINQGLARMNELDFWDEKLSQLGGRIITARQKFSEFLNSQLSVLYQRLAGRDLQCSFQYFTTSTNQKNTSLFQALAQTRENDLTSTLTSMGPHRDDWKIIGEGERNLSHFLSRGEQRSMVGALKILQSRYLKEALHKEPIFLLDELLAELDPLHKQKILENLPQDTQKFLTATDLREIPENMLKQAQVVAL